MREHNHVFSGFLVSSYETLHVRAENLEPHIVNSGFVEGSFFPNLGLEPTIGRLIGPDDDQVNQPSPVAVLSWTFWKNSFNLDPAIRGKQLIVDGVIVTVIGVAPRNFSGLRIEAPEDLWIPLSMEPVIIPSTPERRSVALVGRLKPGASLEQARAEMAVLYESTLDEDARTTGNPYLRKFKFEMEPAAAGHSFLREDFARPLFALMAIAGLLLLIACTNVATMLLARGTAREHELAVRVSLGAGRFRLIRQALTESLVLSVAGSFLGIILAYFGTGWLVRIILAARGVGPSLQFHVHRTSQ